MTEALSSNLDQWVEYGCVSLRMRFFSQNLERKNEFYQGLRHRLTAKALGSRLAFNQSFDFP